MRTAAPEPFSISFSGPEGIYTVHFQPTDERDGVVDVSIGPLSMRWNVLTVHREDIGALVLGGMKPGPEDIWKDKFGFELLLDATPPVLSRSEDGPVGTER